MGFRSPLGQNGRHLRSVPDPAEDRKRYNDQLLQAVKDHIGEGHQTLEEAHQAARTRRERQRWTKLSLEEDIKRAEEQGNADQAACFRLALDAYEDGLGI